MVLLRASGLSVSVGGRPLLVGVDLEVRGGELVALIGPSGAGKTSLLRCLSGLDDPVAGQLSSSGQTPEQLGWPVWRRIVSYLAQRPALRDGTVFENLERPFRYGVAEVPFSETRARELLEQVGLDAQLPEQLVSTLSEGEKQRVSLVRTLLVEPAVLLLDEPTSSLDPDSVAAVERLLRACVADGMRGAVVVTHDPLQADRLCHRRIGIEGFWVALESRNG